MRFTCVAAFLAAILSLPAAVLAEVHVNVNLGVPAPPPVVVAGPPPPTLFSAPPLFLTPPRLGFYVGTGVPYDIMFLGNSYYLYYGNAWYRSPYYNGPWTGVRFEHLPRPIRTHGVNVIRSSRDAEFRLYREHGGQYRGRHFRPGRAVGPGYRNEERRPDREEWRGEHHGERGRGHGRD
jgi:hypothetical protein